MHKTYKEDAHSKLRTKPQKQKHYKKQNQDFPSGDIPKAGPSLQKFQVSTKLLCTITEAEVSKNPEEKTSIVVTHSNNSNIFVNITIVKSIIL